MSALLASLFQTILLPWKLTMLLIIEKVRRIRCQSEHYGISQTGEVSLFFRLRLYRQDFFKKIIGVDAGLVVIT